MAAKRYRRTTTEEHARWTENQDRLEKLLARALDDLGITREELHRRIGLPPPEPAGRRRA